MNGWKVIAFVMAACAVLVVLSMVNTFLGAATGVTQRTLNPDNILAQYEKFHDRCAAIKRYETSLDTQKMLLETAEGSEAERIRANIGGLTAQRAGAIAQYNADATKSNVGIFQGRTLPQRLNPNAPTVCGPYAP